MRKPDPHLLQIPECRRKKRGATRPLRMRVGCMTEILSLNASSRTFNRVARTAPRVPQTRCHPKIRVLLVWLSQVAELEQPHSILVLSRPLPDLASFPHSIIFQRCQAALI